MALALCLLFACHNRLEPGFMIIIRVISIIRLTRITRVTRVIYRHERLGLLGLYVSIYTLIDPDGVVRQSVTELIALHLSHGSLKGH